MKVTSKRGRPVEAKVSDNPEKYTREVVHEDGVKQTWSYDTSISMNGPIKVDISYPSSYVSSEEIEEQLPASKRKYLNPHNGKLVGYARGLALGLVDKKDK